MSKYLIRKERARNLAITWQLNFENNNRSWGYCINWCNRFYKIGKKYGLLREFKENAII